eukprot:2656924-Amphidinium_carterae.1
MPAVSIDQAGVFMDCSKCYERVPLAQLEQRILIQGAVSASVKSTCGLPPGCGLAVDLLHAFLIRTLQRAGRQVEVRKYVDDMVLVASGPHFAHHLRDSYRNVLKALKQANMQ